MWFFIFFLLSDICFIGDLLICFRTAYTREEHELVKRPKLIAHAYLKGSFAFDAIVSIPFDAIFAIADVNHLWYLHLLKLLRVMRFFKLLKIVSKVRQRIQVSQSVLDLVLGVCFLLFIFHLVGCLYCVICREQIRSVLGNMTDQDEANDRVMEYLGSNEWMIPSQYIAIEDAALIFDAGSYIFVVWWAMCAMSGASVSIPQTTVEVIFTFMLVFLGFFVNAYVIGSFTTALAQMSAATNKEREKRDFIDQYMRHKKIPLQLRQQIGQFYQFAGAFFPDCASMRQCMLTMHALSACSQQEVSSPPPVLSPARLSRPPSRVRVGRGRRHPSGAARDSQDSVRFVRQPQPLPQSAFLQELRHLADHSHRAAHPQRVCMARQDGASPDTPPTHPLSPRPLPLPCPLPSSLHPTLTPTHPHPTSRRSSPKECQVAASL